MAALKSPARPVSNRELKVRPCGSADALSPSPAKSIRRDAIPASARRRASITAKREMPKCGSRPVLAMITACRPEPETEPAPRPGRHSMPNSLPSGPNCSGVSMHPPWSIVGVPGHARCPAGAPSAWMGTARIGTARLAQSRMREKSSAGGSVWVASCNSASSPSNPSFATCCPAPVQTCTQLSASCDGACGTRATCSPAGKWAWRRSSSPIRSTVSALKCSSCSSSPSPRPAPCPPPSSRASMSSWRR